MNVLITGASGLVGKQLTSELEHNEKVEIYALTSKPELFKEQRVKAYSYFDIEQVLQTVDIDVMVNLAFPRNVNEEEWADGISYALEALFLAKEYGVKRVINVSSQSIYGWKRKKPASEHDSVVLVSPYTTGKFCTEVTARMLFKKGTFSNIRLATVISPTTKERVVNKLFDKILRKESVEIRDGSQIFSFIDVRDVARALTQMILCQNIEWKETYNLGTSEIYSLLDISKMVVEIAKDAGYEHTDIQVVEDEIPLNNSLDSSAFKADFGWNAKYQLYDTMKQIFDEMIV